MKIKMSELKRIIKEAAATVKGFATQDPSTGLWTYTIANSGKKCSGFSTEAEALDIGA